MAQTDDIGRAACRADGTRRDGRWREERRTRGAARREPGRAGRPNEEALMGAVGQVCIGVMANVTPNARGEALAGAVAVGRLSH
jgi:hypothetical protein